MIRDVKPAAVTALPFWSRRRWHLYLCLWPRIIDIQGLGYRRVGFTVLQRRYSNQNRCWLYRLRAGHDGLRSQ